ncbi:hypothetical protein ACTXKL_14095 [Brachybacterium tyrofermentans]|uniref:hypothetical protein n=1 Tax=Brachybacterium tyrofermentans TaxID=47848 RepID=UPI003FD09191
MNSGQHADNVVLWTQPDGTVNSSAMPVELPVPSDFDEAYWAARTGWALLGEEITGSAAVDTAFTTCLVERRCLALDALERVRSGRYGQ